MMDEKEGDKPTEISKLDIELAMKKMFPEETDIEGKHKEYIERLTKMNLDNIPGLIRFKKSDDFLGESVEDD